MAEFVTFLSQIMGPVMVLWLLVGLGTLIHDLGKLGADEARLTEAKNRLSEARSSDHPTKVRIRGEIVDWADTLPVCGLRRWIYTIHNTVLAGDQADASALTDAIWSQERERHFLFRFFVRNAIMLGLLFTSAGLCVTLADVAPALLAKSGNSQEWIAAVQRAMANALGGMSQAFYSSLAGIGITLVLHVAATFWLIPRHERYLADVDSFVQGTLIPVFASIVEHDRNDVITEAMDRAYEMFAGVKGQYERMLSGFERHESDSRAMRDVLSHGIDLLRQQIQTFAEKTEALDNAAERIREAAEGIVAVIEAQTGALTMAADEHRQMLDRMDQLVEVLSLGGETIQKQLGATYELHRQEVANLYGSIGGDLRQSLAQVAEMAGGEMAQHLSTGLEKAISETHDRVTGLDEVLRAVADRHGETVTALESLSSSLRFNAESLQAELAQRRTFAETVSSQAVQEAASHLERQTESRIDDLADKFAATLDASLQRQEQIIRDLNQAVGVKWEHLLTAYTAGSGLTGGRR